MLEDMRASNVQSRMPAELAGAFHRAPDSLRRLKLVVIFPEIEAGSAHTQSVERVKFGVVDIVLDDRDRSDVVAILVRQQGVNQQAMVRVVWHGMDDDAAREAKLAHDAAHVLERRVRRLVERSLLGRIFPDVLENVELTVAAQGWRGR